MQGEEVLKKIENVGDEEGRPTVTVKIINCGEYSEGMDVAACALDDYNYQEIYYILKHEIFNESLNFTITYREKEGK